MPNTLVDLHSSILSLSLSLSLLDTHTHARMHARYAYTYRRVGVPNAALTQSTIPSMSDPVDRSRSLSVCRSSLLNLSLVE